MKRIAVLLAAVLITMTVSLSVAAEPDESIPVDSDTSVTEQSPTDTPDTETSDTETSDTETSDTETSDTETSDPKSTEQSEEKTSAASEGQKSSKPAETKNNTGYTTYHVKEADMSLAVPSDMYVITRETDKDDPVLALNRMTKEEVMQSFEENDIYFRAVPRDFSCVVNVTVTETPSTKATGDLRSLSEESKQSMINTLLENDIYKDCTKSTYNGVPFLTFTIMYQKDNSKIYGVQHHTIVNGKNVRITYQTATEEKNDPNRAMFAKVMESVQFEKTESSAEALPEPSEALFDMNSIDVRYIYLGIAAVIALLSLIFIIAAASSYKKTKRQAAEAAKAAKAKPVGKKKPAPSAADKESEEKDIFSDTTKKTPSEMAEEKPATVIKPMTYDDVVSGHLQALEQRQAQAAEAADTAAPSGDEVVFAQKSEKRRTEIEKVDAAESVPVGSPSQATAPSEEPQNTPDSAAETPSADKGIELEIVRSDNGGLMIGATNGTSGQPMDIEIRDETRLSEEQDKQLEAMGFETARHDEIYNAVSAEKAENPFVVIPMPVTLDKPADRRSKEETAASVPHEEKAAGTTELSAFEKKSGIVFERAPSPKHPVVPKKNMFTTIPRLESIKADDYNSKYEAMKKKKR